MKRYWISWYSGGYESEGCIDEPPFQYWWTGQRERPNHGLTPEQLAIYEAIEDEDEGYAYLDEHGKSDGTAVALVEADSVGQIWKVISKFFPDYKERFCEERDTDWTPGDRFGNFQNQTKLTGE